ncbi:MAG: ATP-dependent helicase [Pirellulaceae bacterium]|nr:MAG: ATP-dependent helicase [Pirellulaceae bacterium]
MESTPYDFDELRRRLVDVMRADRYRLERWLERMERRAAAGAVLNQEVPRWRQAMEASWQLRQLRAARVPPIAYDPNLPITAWRDRILEALHEWPVVIVCGQTGSGKSTQLPKMCLEAGRGIAGMIGHTQPRRIAAVAIASRIATELGSPLGTVVGYKIRFQERTEPATLVKVMTDGILLAEIQSDRFLEKYDTLIIDEVHERSLNIDFLLGYLRRLLKRRRDLRLLLTSATLDAARYSEFFRTPRGPCPVIEIPGRGYPVEIRYCPAEVGEEEIEPDMAAAIRRALEELSAEPEGDVLVFLATEREIRQVARSLRGWVINQAARRWEILPLYARLPAAEQQKVFAPHQHPRIVLATNVAESSLTVPGIRYVIDTGTARISRYSPKAKLQRLPIEPVSRASADQRAGRCGRLAPGICIRLYSEEDYLSREAFTTPEIRRTNLASVILQAKCLGIGSIEQLEFLDPPRPEMVRDGYRTLFELGAIDERRQLTPLGRRLGQLPVDPRVARMILAAVELGCVHEVLVVAAALEVGDPRLRPAEETQAADQVHRRWADERSDFLTLLNLWDDYQQMRGELSRSALRSACRERFLSLTKLSEWSELYRQLRALVQRSGHPVTSRRDDYTAVHRALLAGLLSGIAYRHQAYEYRGAGQLRCYLWPGSSVFSMRPKWIMAAEIVETTRRYARMVAQIEPEWAEPLASHLIEKRHVNPVWSRRRGTALVTEKVSLFGLPLIHNRIIPLKTVDPQAARKLFIERGLVGGELAGHFRFLEHNRQVIRKLLEYAGKSRESVWFRLIQTQSNFYEERLPPQVVDLASLRAWLPQAERRNPRALYLDLEHLLPEQQPLPDTKAFPDTLPDPANPLPLEYRFAPGEPLDGVTLTVPVSMVPELDGEQLEWFIPGRIHEKVTELIRSLPPPIRRSLIPAPDTARSVLEQIPFGQGPLLRILARALSRRAGMRIQPSDFRLDQIPSYLRFHFRLLDGDGRTLLVTQDWQQVRLAAQQNGRPPAPAAWHRDGLVTWDFEELPDEVWLEFDSVRVPRYVALVDQGSCVGLRTVSSPGEADRLTRRAVRRLLFLAERPALLAQLVWMPAADKMRRWAEPLMDANQWEEQVMLLLVQRAMEGLGPPPRSAKAFEQLHQQVSQRLPLAAQEVALLLPKLFERYWEAYRICEQNANPALDQAREDIRRQLERLTAGQFLVETPWRWLEQFPRYFQAILYRCERILSGNWARDQQLLAEWCRYAERYELLRDELAELGRQDPALEEYRWMLEEFRVALFAQPLGTLVPVSAKRLDAQWAKVRQVG